MQNITPFLWFNDNAGEAVNFYLSIFKNSKTKTITYYGEAGPGPKGTIMTIAFELDGQEFTAINGGPVFKFNEAVSFVVRCDTQKEIDEKWEKLAEGGEKGQCGWLKDKFGLSWQIVPPVLIDMLKDGDPIKSNRVMNAMFQMTKLDIGILKQAYNQD